MGDHGHQEGKDPANANANANDGGKENESTNVMGGTGEQFRSLPRTTEKLDEEELKRVLECESVAGDEEFLGMLFQTMAEQLVGRISKIGECLDSDDTETIWKEAHTTKGSSLQCALNRLGQASKDLERSFRKPEGDDVAKRWEYLKAFQYESTRVLNTVKDFSGDSS